MRLKDKKLLIFSTINCFLFVIFFLKSGGYSLTESSSVETSINIVNTTPAPIIVKTTKEVIPAFTGDVIANDLYQKYLGKIFLILMTNPLDGQNTKKPKTKTADFFVNTHISVKSFKKSQNNNIIF